MAIPGAAAFGPWRAQAAVDDDYEGAGIGTEAPVAGRWYCVEVDVVLAAVEGTVRLFVDGRPQGVARRRTLPDAGSGPEVDRFSINVGLIVSGPSNGQEVFIDDVAMQGYPDDVSDPETPRLGCD